MGKSSKQTLKAGGNKNGKNKECESEVEKSQEKMRRKRKSFWSKWSSLFSRSAKMRKGWEKVEQETQVQQMMMNTQSQDLERWGQEEPADANSGVLNIPIEPGRQVSTIILRPTKTGFKAVIAHYGINMAQSLTKDMNAVAAQFENRRTLTLVFDMNTATFDDAAVGQFRLSLTENVVSKPLQLSPYRKSESTLVDSRKSETARSSKSMSASALFVRTGADDIVESAAFLQAQLSIENAAPAPSSIDHPEKTFNTDKRQMSCRSFQRPRVAFKTISEPLWQDKQKMQKELVMKQNIQQVLNQFIFLDRDDSLMNYPRLCEEVTSENNEADEPINYDYPFAVDLLRSNEDARAGRTPFTSKMSFSFDRISELSSSSIRNVSPELLVNIKPFKEYVTNCQKLDFLPERPVSRSEKMGVFTKRPAMMLGPPVKKSTFSENFIKPRESQETNQKLLKPVNKSRLSLCIKCGVKAKGDEPKLSKGKFPHISRTVSRTSARNDADCKKKSSLKVIAEGREGCTLCSTWKMYNKASLTRVNLTSDSIEDILQELEGYDHTSMFKRNISQFKTKIKTRSNAPTEFKSSHSSLSFAEVIELEEGKLTCLKNTKGEDLPNVTLRLVEFVRKTGDKTVQLQRIKKSFEKLMIEDVVTTKAESSIMENSCLLLSIPQSNHMIKVMAQKTEESMSTNIASVGEAHAPEETIQLVFPAFATLPPKRHRSENTLQEYRGCFSKRTGQIPDLISHLWMDKIDNLRNELIARMNETRMSYDPSSYHSAHLIRLKGRQKGSSRCSVVTTTSHILSTDSTTGSGHPGSDNTSGKSEKSEERASGTHQSSTIPEEPSALTHIIRGKTMDQQEESTELHSEDLQSAGPNDQIISFTNPDFKIHSCLTFFVPFVQQIQTAVEILNSAMYSFPVRKVEDQIDRDCLQSLRSYTILSDKKKYFVHNELDSLILKKCIEKNVVSGMTTSTTSKKEITTIKGSRSGNHLLVTNKKILTTNDRIKKTEVHIGGIDDESHDKITQGDKSEDIRNVSEDGEDLNGVHCLYYNKTDEESSEATDYSDGKVCESQSSVIAVSELDESVRPRDETRVNHSDALSYEQSPTEEEEEDEILNPNIANDSLQETDRGIPGKLSKTPVKSHSVNLLQKTALEAADEGEVTGRLTIEDGKCQSKSDVISIQTPPSDSQIESVKVTEEKLIINEADENRVLIHEKVKASGDKIIKKTGEGGATQRFVGKKVCGKIVICRGDNCSPSEKPSPSKRMSVVVTLSRHMPEKKTSSKCHANETRTRGLLKTVEAKCPVSNQNDLPKEHGEVPKPKTNRSNDNSYCFIQRKR